MIKKPNIGDKICVVVFPPTDIDCNEYEIYGGGGIVLEVNENSVIVELFDGAIIEAKGTEFEILN